MSNSMAPKSVARRRFLMVGAGAVAAVPLCTVLGSLKAYADELPRLEESNAQAVALGYKHDAASVDTQKYPKRAGDAGASQFCRNCNLYQAAGDAEWGPCSIFPGKSVAGRGWCNAWVPRG